MAGPPEKKTPSIFLLLFPTKVGENVRRLVFCYRRRKKSPELKRPGARAGALVGCARGAGKTSCCTPDRAGSEPSGGREGRPSRGESVAPTARLASPLAFLLPLLCSCARPRLASAWLGSAATAASPAPLLPLRGSAARYGAESGHVGRQRAPRPATRVSRRACGTCRSVLACRCRTWPVCPSSKVQSSVLCSACPVHSQ